jgi:iron complex transport system ATP-binding protein
VQGAGWELNGLTFRHGPCSVLSDVSLRMDAAEVIALAGPNGAGKSTLLNILSGWWNGYEGACSYAGREVKSWDRTEFARRVAHVPQQLPALLPFTVREVVSTGCAPHAVTWLENAAERSTIDEAMKAADCYKLRTRAFESLSGGEKQRVLLAAALAQKAECLLLDETTAHLDIAHQVAFWQLLRQLQQRGILSIVITHDLNLAAAHADRVLLLEHGRLAADAEPEEALRAETIARVFAVPVRRHQSESGFWIQYGG